MVLSTCVKASQNQCYLKNIPLIIIIKRETGSGSLPQEERVVVDSVIDEDHAGREGLALSKDCSTA